MEKLSDCPSDGANEDNVSERRLGQRGREQEPTSSEQEHRAGAWRPASVAGPWGSNSTSAHRSRTSRGPRVIAVCQGHLVGPLAESRPAEVSSSAPGRRSNHSRARTIRHADRVVIVRSAGASSLAVRKTSPATVCRSEWRIHWSLHGRKPWRLAGRRTRWIHSSPSKNGNRSSSHFCGDLCRRRIWTRYDLAGGFTNCGRADRHPVVFVVVSESNSHQWRVLKLCSDCR